MPYNLSDCLSSGLDATPCRHVFSSDYGRSWGSKLADKPLVRYDAAIEVDFCSISSRLQQLFEVISRYPSSDALKAANMAIIATFLYRLTLCQTLKSSSPDRIKGAVPLDADGISSAVAACSTVSLFPFLSSNSTSS